MNITRENTGELTATIRIEILKDDYEEKVLKQIKDFQHKANIPGFRPGKVPVGLIRKMYGKAIVADEVNKIMSDSIAKYILDEKLDVLGNPLPSEGKNHDYTFEAEKDFEFFFDLGIAPEIVLNVAGLPPVSRYSIAVDDKMLGNYIEDMRKRYGNSIHPEAAGEEDMISCEITETDTNGVIIENGIKKNVFITISQLKKEDTQKRFIGLKKEDNILITHDFFEDKEEEGKILGIKDEVASKEGIIFSLAVKDMYHIEPAELNEEFFKKVYPGAELTTEEQFREQVKKDISASFTGETDKLLYRHVSDTLLHEIPIKLPDSFLKRWLTEHKESKLTAEEVEEQYDSFAESMKWQLIENKLIREYNIRVEDTEIRDYIKNYFLHQIPMNMDEPEAEKRFDSLVDTVMKNTEQVQKINDELFTNKLIQVLKTNFPLEEKEISYEEFITLASAKHEHDHEHEHNHEH
ncbi:MAG: trigger factor [Bacteroidales bacterium]|jgi:trigger factor